MSEGEGARLTPLGIMLWLGFAALSAMIAVALVRSGHSTAALACAFLSGNINLILMSPGAVRPAKPQVSAARPQWTGDELRKEAAVLAVRANERRAIRAEALEEAAACVPTNWLDGLLTGDGGLGEMPWHCPQIENLLRGIQVRIRSLSNTQG